MYEHYAHLMVFFTEYWPVLLPASYSVLLISGFVAILVWWLSYSYVMAEEPPSGTATAWGNYITCGKSKGYDISGVIFLFGVVYPFILGLLLVVFSAMPIVFQATLLSGMLVLFTAKHCVRVIRKLKTALTEHIEDGKVVNVVNLKEE